MLGDLSKRWIFEGRRSGINHMELNSSGAVVFTEEEERTYGAELEDNPVRDALRAHWAEVERIKRIVLGESE